MEKEESARIIKSVALALSLKTYELAEKLEINKQQMYDYTMAKRIPSWGFWTKLKATYPQLSGDYLLTGKGSIFLE
jgi:hypothetical protein